MWVMFPTYKHRENTPTSVYDLFASFISNKPVFYIKIKAYIKIKESLALFNAENLIDKL